MLQSKNADEMARCEPFFGSKWITNFLPFDPITSSTYCEFRKGEQLYEAIGNHIVKHSDQSYRFTPKPNVTKATRILENLARIAKHQNDIKSLNEEEKKEVIRKNEEKMREQDEKAKEKIITSLGLGLHEFEFENNKFYAVHQAIGDPVGGGYSCSNPLIFQSIIIFVKGRGNIKILKHFVNDLVSQTETEKDSLFFKIYRFSMQRNYWRNTGKKIARDPETIILPSVTWTKLMNDFERFIDEKSIKWYFKHGIPYKRSYLFYGVPGSGKSSLIQALAGKYDRNLAFLQPTHPKMTDEAFKTCIQSAPGNSLIVLEDIDALFNKDRSKKEENCPLTFSGLLNGLDGVGNPDGQIFIMTTNFVDRLDNALIRSGRVDLHIEFPLATDEQLSKMFLLFYPNSKKLSNEFVNKIRENFKNGISMAAVQQHFIQNMFAEPKVIINNVKELGDRLDVVTEYDKEKERLKKEKEEKEKDEKKQEKEEEKKQEVVPKNDDEKQIEKKEKKSKEIKEEQKEEKKQEKIEIIATGSTGKK